MSKKSGKEQYLDAKYVTDNPNKFDYRDVARAREFCEGYEAGQHETIFMCNCDKPKPPTPIYLRESTSHTCPKCGSSHLRRLGFLWFIGCVNPNCMNYHGGFPNKKYDPRFKIYT